MLNIYYLLYYYIYILFIASVTAAGCCSATAVYSLPMAIFKGVRILESHKQNLLTGSTVQMTEFCYINETVSVMVASLNNGTTSVHISVLC
jgi:hypothetical protein